MADRKLDIIVRMRNQASKGLKGVDRDVKSLGATTKTAAKSMAGLYTSMAAFAGILAGGALLGKAIKDFAAFDDNMRAAGAVTNATTEELKAMTAVAQKMGRETRYTAANAAEALKFLGMAGLEAAEAMDALPGVLSLAAAGSLDLGTAADIATNVLSAFGLEVESLSRVNDVLVKTFTSSNVNLMEIGEAFKMVGPIAKGVGADFEDLVGTIGALGNAGIKGTMAGTALKNAIDALLVPTAQEEKLMKQLEQRMGGATLQIKDAEGNFIGFTDILKQLEAAGMDGIEALELFGMRAGPSMAALLNMGSESLDELIEKLREAGGTADQIAEQMEAGLGGTMRRLISAFEGFKIQIGKTFEKDTTELLDFFIIQLQDLNDALQNNEGIIKFWSDVAVWSIKAISGAFEFVPTLFINLGKLMALFSLALNTSIWDFRENKKVIKDGLMEVNDSFKHFFDKYGLIKTKIVVTDGTDWESLNAEIDKGLEGAIGKGTGKTKKERGKEIEVVSSRLKSGFIKLRAILKQESEQIKGEYEQGLITLGAYYEKRAEIIKKGIEAELGILSHRLQDEEDLSKQEELKAQIFSKKKELETALLVLTNDRIQKETRLEEKKNRDLERATKKRLREEKKANDLRLRAEKKINELRLQAEQAFTDQKARIAVDGETELDAQFADEIASLQERQNKELEIIREFQAAVLAEMERMGVSEVEIAQKVQDQKKRIKDQEVVQQQEKDQLEVDHQARTFKSRIQMMQTLAGGAAQAFDQLYEMSGKKTKEFFYLAKAASIAQATMKMHEGIVGALGSPPYGWAAIANSIIIGAQGAIQIAAIASQGFAKGGVIKGNSPTTTADNIPIRATAGEFIHPVDSVKYYGKSFMEAIRTKSLPRMAFASGYSQGGYVKSGHSSFAQGGLVSKAQDQRLEQEDKEIVINNINVVDPREMINVLSTPEGQNGVLNVLSSRPEDTRRIFRSIR